MYKIEKNKNKNEICKQRKRSKLFGIKGKGSIHKKQKHVYIKTEHATYKNEKLMQNGTISQEKIDGKKCKKQK